MNFAISIKLLEKLFFLAVLMPFISPLPLNTDTQPIAFILGFLLLIFKNLFTKEDIILLFFGLVLLCFLNPNYELNLSLGKYLSFFSGVVIFIAAKRVNFFNHIDVFNTVLSIYFFYTVFFNFFPEIAFSIQENFVRANNTGNESDPFAYRGIPTFSTEPGLFGGLLIFFLLINEYFKTALSYRRYLLNFLLIIFMIFLTKSGTGYFYLLLYLLIWGILNLRLIVFFQIIFYFILIGVLIIYLDIGSSNRGFQIIQNLFLDFESFTGESSIYGRFLDLISGFILLFDSKTVGFNAVQVNTEHLALNYNFIGDYYGKTSYGLVSSLSFILTAYSFFGLFLLVYIYGSSLDKTALSNILFSIIFLSFSYSAAFPAIWVLLNLKKYAK